MNRLLMLFALLLASPSLGLSATYYISPTGNDSNAGTAPSIPWLTFTFAIPTLRAGDTLFALNGTYTRSTTGLPRMDCSSGVFSGTSTAPITLKAQNERQAHLSGDGASVVYMFGCSWWVLEGLYASNVDVSNGNFDGSVFYIESSDHIVTRRNLAYNENAWQNSHCIQYAGSSDGLAEENEIYYCHRHGLAFLEHSNRNTARRNYIHSRDHADMPGGYESDPPAQGRGDTGITCYPCNTLLAENNISEDWDSGFDIQCKSDCDDNKYYGNIALGTHRPYLFAARRTDAGVDGTADNMPKNVVMQHNYAGASDMEGSCGFFRSNRNLTITNHTCKGGNGGGMWMDESSIPGDGNYTFTATNVLITGFTGNLGWSVENQTSWNVNYTGVFDNPGGYDPALSDSHYTNTVTSNPNLGTCQVYLPDASPYKTAGAGGAPIGAMILYRYQNGTLGTTPLWDTGTGKYTGCGVVVAGVNDVAGSSCQDVHVRLNVGQGGCALPSNYTGGAVITPAFLAQLRMDAGSGTTAIDSTGNGYNGTLIGSPTWTAGRVGRYGISFGAIGQYVEIAQEITTSQYTWALSVRGVTAPAASAATEPMSAHATGAIGFQWNQATPEYRQAVYHAAADETLVRAQLTTPLQAGVWYRIAASYDGTTLKAYLNGVLQSSVAIAPPPTIGQLHFGGNASTAAFTGSVDEFRLWNYALSAADILQDYRSTAGAPRHRLLRW